MKTHHKNSFGIWSGAVGLVLLLIIIGAVVATFGNLRLRHDFTEDRLYTLSPGSRAILGKLENEVTLKFYFNRSSAATPMFIKSYARQVEDLLKEYQLAGKGRLAVEIYDPEPDSDEEEWAQRYGVQAQQTGMFTPPMYFGLVAVSGDREEVLAALAPQTESTLEYDITRLITRVASADKPIVGVLSTLPVMGAPEMPPGMSMPRRESPQPWFFIRELKRDFEVRTVAPDVAEIDPAITTLLVIHPKELGPSTLYAIDQFVMRGGRLIACVDPLSLADMESQSQAQMGMFGMGGQGPSTLGPLFSAWGIGFDSGKVVADPKSRTRLGGAEGGIEESPVFLTLKPGNLNAGDLLTAQLDRIMLPFAGALTDATDDDVTFEPLLTSSDVAALVDSMTAQFGSAALRGQMHPDGMKHVMAARLGGLFKSAYPEGPPSASSDDSDDETPDSPPAENHRTICDAPNAMLVIADADFLMNRVSVREMEVLPGFNAMQPLNDNLALIANTVERLSGSTDLIAIRSRGRSTRPFTKVDELEYRAAEAWRAEEEKLNAELQNTRRQLAELQGRKDGSQKFILSPEQEEAIERFRRREIEVRSQLKNVRRNLRKDVERLGVRIKAINIAAMPLLVIVLGIGKWLLSRRVVRVA